MAIIPTVRCRNMRQSLDFYRGIVGFERVGGDDRLEDPCFSILALGDDRLMLSSHRGDGEYGQAIVIETGNVDDVCRTLRARGLRTPGDPDAPREVHEGPIDQTWGSREFYVDDPDGNTLRFVQWHARGSDAQVRQPSANGGEGGVELRTPVCIVRSYRVQDAESLARNADSRKVWLNLRDRFPHPFRVADGVAYIADVLSQPQQTRFAITVGDDAVGGISLRIGTDIERVTAELGYWLGEPYWGRGIASAAVAAVTQYGFDALGLRRIFAIPFVENVASCRVLEKAGYVREGLMRASAIKDGTVRDQYLYARTVD